MAGGIKLIHPWGAGVSNINPGGYQFDTLLYQINTPVTSTLYLMYISIVCTL